MRNGSRVLSLLLVAFAISGNAQSVVVNPDGTHSVILHSGSTSIIVNPNGTHSTVFNNGNTSVQVNPDGTHSVIFHSGSTSIRVNPDGTHSTIYNNGSTSVQINPDGTQTTATHQRVMSDYPNENGTQLFRHDNSTPLHYSSRNNVWSSASRDSIPAEEAESITSAVCPSGIVSSSIRENGQRVYQHKLLFFAAQSHNKIAYDHHQLHFSIGQLYSRELNRITQALLSQNTSKSGIRAMTRRLLKEQARLHKLYDRETDHGRIDTAQEIWALRIANELQLLDEYSSNSPGAE